MISDFINIRGQQNIEEEAITNPIEIKIENDKIQNMFEKYKTALLSSPSKGCFFQTAQKTTRKKYL